MNLQPIFIIFIFKKSQYFESAVKLSKVPPQDIWLNEQITTIGDYWPVEQQ